MSRKMNVHKKIVATIEGRMTSSRLPGKLMLPVLNRPILASLTNRLKAVASIDQIVLATTTNVTDDVLVKFAEEENIDVFRGDEEDVMGRVIGAGSSVDADIIVEITGDCPLIDPDIVEQTIQVFLRNAPAQYCANSFYSTYPDGMDTQVFTLEALKKSYELTNDPLDREHVSRYMVNHPELFPAVYLVAPPSLTWPGLGLTLDEPADYTLICKIIEHFGEKDQLFGCGEIIKLLRKNPDWLSVNENVQRKNLRPL